MRHCFGPVPSRRLGISLGIDLLPDKICNFNCIYCELGPGKEFVDHSTIAPPLGDIRGEMEEMLRGRGLKCDVVTITASGEPTLHKALPEVISLAKSVSQLPVAVLTNGSLLWREEVALGLMEADLVLPSLDAVTQSVFRKVNRPYRGLTAEQVIEGLKGFRERFKGEIWLETLFVKGINDSPEEIERLRGAVAGIRPHRLQVNTVDRPPTEPWARPVDGQRLEETRNFLNQELEAVIPRFQGHQEGNTKADEGAVLDAISRRPMTIEEMEESLGYHRDDIEELLQRLIEQGVAQKRRFGHRSFYLGVPLENGNLVGEPCARKR